MAEHSQYLQMDKHLSGLNNISDKPVGGEGEGIDSVGVVQGVEVLAVVEVPQHGLNVLVVKSFDRFNMTCFVMCFPSASS